MARDRTANEQVVILGEDGHDRATLKILIAALRKDLPAGSLRPLRQPMTLVKDIPPDRLPRKADKVRATLRAVHVRQPIRCVFMHEDADACEPAHMKVTAKIEQTYRALPYPVLAVVPAWEIEAWWFLFPDAVSALHRSWRRPDQYRGQAVGKIRNAKERLRQCVRPTGLRGSTFREYAESDSVEIAKRVVEMGLLTRPLFAVSASWDAFAARVAKA